MQGAKRVIVFCLMVVFLPITLLITPLYLRHTVYGNVSYTVAESDIIQIDNGISSIFCKGHSLEMNVPFSAFQLKKDIELLPNLYKHIKMKKSMSLPDDTLEYWGFFLPKGSNVSVSVCSRYDGSRILVVKGEQNLRNCGLMKPSVPTPHFAKEHGLVHVKTMSNKNVTKADSLLDPTYDGEVEDASDPSPDSAQEKKKPKPKLTQEKRNENRKKLLAEALNKDLVNSQHPNHHINKRTMESHKLDGGVAHGGNALNFSLVENDSSASSFETSLLTCYDGLILLSQGFDPSKECNSTKYLENGNHIKTTHAIISDGYYYYIFYSDNDYVQNDIHAIFDIYKPTFHYGNYSNSCINTTNCHFPITFLSDDIVVVEVPTIDGIEHEMDVYHLTSVCEPRPAVYAIFPVAILLLILTCAFL